MFKKMLFLAIVVLGLGSVNVQCGLLSLLRWGRQSQLDEAFRQALWDNNKGDNNITTIESLLNQGANIDITDGDGRTALMWAIIHQRNLVNFFLTKGAKVNAQDDAGNTPLIIAALFNTEALKPLIDNGAKVNIGAKDGFTALMAAARHNPEALPPLIKAGANVKAKDKKGFTASMIAAQFHPEALQILIDAGANGNDQKIDERSPLLAAIAHNSPYLNGIN